jgi:MFS family permease
MRRAGRTLLVCVAAFGVTMIAFALSRSFLLSLLLLAASGAVDNVSVVLRSTLLQMVTPAHMLGRVSSVNQVFIGSSNEIGAFESGLAARLMGLVPSVVFGGCMTLLVVATTAWRVPELRKMDRIG